MRRTLFAVSMFSVCGLLIVSGANRSLGQPDLGPGEKGATLRLPGSEAPRPQEPMPGYFPGGTAAEPKNPFGAASPFTPGLSNDAKRIAKLPSNDVGINRDIEITANQGPWIIYVMSYSGEDAPKLAREFVAELRNNMKLAAYVYNSGAKEKAKEFERVQKAKQEQIEALQKAGLKGDYLPTPIRAVRIDEQTAVLIDGGFRTREDALAALKKLRASQLPKGFAERVKLDVKIAIEVAAEKGAKTGGVHHEAVLVNPFVRAFPARNPEVKHDEAPQLEKVDVELLNQLNKEEVFSVLKTKKPFTLAIKQYNTQQIVARNQREADGFMDRFKKGLTLGPNKEWSDHAAQSAHDLADAFRKSGLAETYVLHAKYCSYVTVGGFDSVQDNRLTIMQNFLESQLQKDAYRPLELFPRPVPMAVPH